ncbi:KIF-binding protein-like [Venturia canescens]|uniref:KIF-binding protein-like n=1 Tax=Venturia canescens TaxID=32260 RepID=UPI001C9C695B|nr:KIF-binding protein-like [Venturia canescens]
MKDEDLTMWALRAARLASYFLSKNRFVEARNHLSAAIHVLHEYEKKLKATDTSKTEKLNDFRRKYADVAKCWVKYGLFLFSVSKTNMVSQFCCEPNQVLDKLWTVPFKNIDNNSFLSTKEGKNVEALTDATKNSSPPDGRRSKVQFFLPDEKSSEAACHSTGSSEKVLGNEESRDNSSHFSAGNSEKPSSYLIFESLTELSESENEVAASLIETTGQARSLFLHTHSWLKKVKTYYNLNEYPMEYVNVVLDLSELYRYLAFYEEEIESQYAVQKLRADALETLSTVLREIRPQCYISVSVELLRELAEVQLEMMGLNLRRIYAAKEATSRDTSETTLHKMDALADIHSRLEQFRDNFSHIDDPERKCDTQNATSERFSHFIV